MTLAPNYFNLKSWEKDGHQEMRSTSYKQEINPRSTLERFMVPILPSILVFLNARVVKKSTHH
jgi:hypothetical protein